MIIPSGDRENITQVVRGRAGPGLGLSDYSSALFSLEDDCQSRSHA